VTSETRAWRFWTVDLDSGCLASPLSWMGTGDATLYPDEVNTPETVRTPTSPSSSPDAGLLFASLDAAAAVAGMRLMPLPPAMLAYGEVALLGELAELPLSPGLRLNGEVATAGALRIVSLALCESIPNATRCRVRLRYPNVRLLKAWPRFWWQDAAPNRARLVERIEKRRSRPESEARSITAGITTPPGLQDSPDDYAKRRPSGDDRTSSLGEDEAS
jgi:hypothetical protein